MTFVNNDCELCVQSSCGHASIVLLKGMRGDKGNGKYVVGYSARYGDTPVLAFDASCELHRDIAVSCDITVSGGGRMEWDADTREIRLVGKSMEFGQEPNRDASRAIIQALFIDWMVS